jgi:NAD(P)-dependent dehydrogenase (short-subunit alcohol dehydrogenase family)
MTAILFLSGTQYRTTYRFGDGELVIARVPSRRMSSLDEVAKAVVFLASDDASNIHGSTLSVDGGFSAV